MSSQIGRHNGDGAAEKRERGSRHALIFDGEQLEDTAAGGLVQQVDGIEGPFERVEIA
jgi:hypothetical protein